MSNGTDGFGKSVCPIYVIYVSCDFCGNVIDVVFVINTNRRIWEDEEVFLGIFKGVAKERGNVFRQFAARKAISK